MKTSSPDKVLVDVSPWIGISEVNKLDTNKKNSNFIATPLWFTVIREMLMKGLAY